MSKRLASDRPGESYYVSFWFPGHASGDDAYSVFVAPFDLELEEAIYLPEAAVTGNDGQGATLSLFDGGADGSGTGSMASIDFTSTDTVAAEGDKETFTLASSAGASARQLDAGDVLVVNKAEQGTDAFDVQEGYIYLRFKAQ